MTDAEYGRTIDRNIGFIADHPEAVASGMWKELGKWWDSLLASKAEGVMTFGFETAATGGFSTLSKAGFVGRLAGDAAEVAERGAARAAAQMLAREAAEGGGMVDDAVAGATHGVAEFAENGERMIRVYRGVKCQTAQDLHVETGHLLSDAAIDGFYETGSIPGAMNYASKIHEKWIRIFGSEARFVEEHAIRGDEMQREFGLRRTFMSTTTDIERAKYYAGEHGVVYTGLVPESLLFKQTLKTSTESEFLVKFGSERFSRWSPDP